ncbi:DUF5018-related domain-containing protein [Marinifilum sp. RC60d5]|uniref:DUF5018-related domain-containing protein n=1 Tax=Marinifilum sp. RC60d5 TaxID=3458414 RepID=UPI0040354C41
MKNLVKYTIILFSMILFTSCLESGLDDLPAYEEANITNFKFEYRWMGKNGDNDQLNVYQMEVANTIDTVANTVDCVITVPAVSDDFPAEQRDLVELTNLVGYCSISNAATISPVGDAPVLGEIKDYSGSDLKYEVVAANGTAKIWTLTISEFIK